LFRGNCSYLGILNDNI